LARLGYRVLSSDNQAHAIELCQSQERIDLLLTDVMMPGMTGPELAKRLVAMRPTLKVLYMSGYADDATLRQGILEHGVRLLQKPMSLEALAQGLREALDGAA
jgi:CheY-like chemotaxis protein